uniref:Nuclear receptor domain-containing protein n=1 Tax=Heterorhabditis bacteriophora TaxID=37862 RepID=A0A1I7WQS7_HETBA
MKHDLRAVLKFVLYAVINLPVTTTRFPVAMGDIRCACRSCRFNKCLEVGMNPKAIQTTRLGFESKESSAFRRQLSSDHCIRKRTYDICSILDMEPSCSSLSSKCVSRSISPNDTTLPTNKKKMRESEMHEYIKHAHDLENRLFLLRKSDFLSSTSLLDVLTRPCALNNAHKYEKKSYYSDYLCILYPIMWILRKNLYSQWNTPNHTLGLGKCHLLISRHLKSIKEGIERVKVDQTTFALLNAIVLCDCACFSLSTQSKEILKVERDKFLDALGAHLFENDLLNGGNDCFTPIKIFLTPENEPG